MSQHDPATAEAFAENFLGVLNGAALALMTSIGHRSGLFDTMNGMQPATASEIAAAARLHPRYVREWLDAMVTGGVVEVDDSSRLYRLPPAHAACLTRSAGANNMAAFAQYISILGAVEDDVLACFKKGGGVPYEKFPRFHAVMADDSAQSVLSSLDSHVLPLVPGLVERLRDGIRVLDLGCGSGRILNRLATMFPNSRFSGLDLSRDAIGVANSEARSAGLTNTEFHVRDLTDLHETAPERAYEWITTFDAIHDQAKPLNVLKGICRALTDDGVYLMQEIKGSSFVRNNIGHPIGTFLYTISTMHCMTVSLAQGGDGLGAMWGEEKTRDYLEQAGFHSVVKHELAHDIQNNWYVVKKVL